MKAPTRDKRSKKYEHQPSQINLFNQLCDYADKADNAVDVASNITDIIDYRYPIKHLKNVRNAKGNVARKAGRLYSTNVSQRRGRRKILKFTQRSLRNKKLKIGLDKISKVTTPISYAIDGINFVQRGQERLQDLQAKGKATPANYAIELAYNVGESATTNFAPGFLGGLAITAMGVGTGPITVPTALGMMGVVGVVIIVDNYVAKPLWEKLENNTKPYIESLLDCQSTQPAKYPKMLVDKKEANTPPKVNVKLQQYKAGNILVYDYRSTNFTSDNIQEKWNTFFHTGRFEVNEKSHIIIYSPNTKHPQINTEYVHKVTDSTSLSAGIALGFAGGKLIWGVQLGASIAVSSAVVLYASGGALFGLAGYLLYDKFKTRPLPFLPQESTVSKELTKSLASLKKDGFVGKSLRKKAASQVHSLMISHGGKDEQLAEKLKIIMLSLKDKELQDFDDWKRDDFNDSQKHYYKRLMQDISKINHHYHNGDIIKAEQLFNKTISEKHPYETISEEIRNLFQPDKLHDFSLFSVHQHKLDVAKKFHAQAINRQKSQVKKNQYRNSYAKELFLIDELDLAHNEVNTVIATNYSDPINKQAKETKNEGFLLRARIEAKRPLGIQSINAILDDLNTVEGHDDKKQFIIFHLCQLYQEKIKELVKNPNSKLSKNYEKITEAAQKINSNDYLDLHINALIINKKEDDLLKTIKQHIHSPISKSTLYRMAECLSKLYEIGKISKDEFIGAALEIIDTNKLSNKQLSNVYQHLASAEQNDSAWHDRDNAIYYLQKAIEHNPRNKTAAIRLAKEYDQTGRWLKARRTLTDLYDNVSKDQKEHVAQYIHSYDIQLINRAEFMISVLCTATQKISAYIMQHNHSSVNAIRWSKYSISASRALNALTRYSAGIYKRNLSGKIASKTHLQLHQKSSGANATQKTNTANKINLEKINKIRMGISALTLLAQLGAILSDYVAMGESAGEYLQYTVTGLELTNYATQLPEIHNACNSENYYLGDNLEMLQLGMGIAIIASPYINQYYDDRRRKGDAPESLPGIMCENVSWIAGHPLTQTALFVANNSEEIISLAQTMEPYIPYSPAIVAAAKGAGAAIASGGATAATAIKGAGAATATAAKGAAVSLWGAGIAGKVVVVGATGGAIVITAAGTYYATTSIHNHFWYKNKTKNALLNIKLNKLPLAEKRIQEVLSYWPDDLKALHISDHIEVSKSLKVEGENKSTAIEKAETICRKRLQQDPNDLDFTNLTASVLLNKASIISTETASNQVNKEEQQQKQLQIKGILAEVERLSKSSHEKSPKDILAIQRLIFALQSQYKLIEAETYLQKYDHLLNIHLVGIGASDKGRAENIKRIHGEKKKIKQRMKEIDTQSIEIYSMLSSNAKSIKHTDIYLLEFCLNDMTTNIIAFAKEHVGQFFYPSLTQCIDSVKHLREKYLQSLALATKNPSPEEITKQVKSNEFLQRLSQLVNESDIQFKSMLEEYKGAVDPEKLENIKRGCIDTSNEDEAITRLTKYLDAFHSNKESGEKLLSDEEAKLENALWDVVNQSIKLLVYSTGAEVAGFFIVQFFSLLTHNRIVQKNIDVAIQAIPLSDWSSISSEETLSVNQLLGSEKVRSSECIDAFYVSSANAPRLERINQHAFWATHTQTSPFSIRIAEEEHETKRPEIDYIRRPVDDTDDDCSYSAYGIDRYDAYQLLNEALDNEKYEIIQPVLEPHIKELLSLPVFIDHLQSNGSLDENMTLKDILKIYIEFDVFYGEVKSGWAHPVILQALAVLENKDLYLWELDIDEKLCPYIPLQHDNKPALSNTNERLDLLFVDNNHFERIQVISCTEEVKHEIESRAVFHF